MGDGLYPGGFGFRSIPGGARSVDPGKIRQETRPRTRGGSYARPDQRHTIPLRSRHPRALAAARRRQALCEAAQSPLVTATGLTNLRDFSPGILNVNQMKYRPSRAFILCMAPMLAAGAAGGWAWKKVNSERGKAPAGASFLWVLRHMPFNDDFYPPPMEVISKIRQEATKRMDQLVTEFPALRITEHPVRDDQNGFLLFFKPPWALSGDELPLTKEFEHFLLQQDDKIPWSPEIAKRCLAENAHVVAQIERIASLKTRWSANMPAGYNGFVGARTP